MKNQISKMEWIILQITIVLCILGIIYQGWFNTAFNALMVCMFIYEGKKTRETWNYVLGGIFAIIFLGNIWLLIK